MELVLSKIALAHLLKIVSDHHETIFKQKMSVSEILDLRVSFEKSFKEERLIYEQLPNGKIAYFIQFNNKVMYELNEEIFTISHCFCLNIPKYRRKFYALIKARALQTKKGMGIKKMAIILFNEDLLSKRYFSKKGKLTYIELVGETSYGLKILSKEKTAKTQSIKVDKIKVNDISKLGELERNSHLQDKSSRMRDVFSRPESLKEITVFYKNLLKRNSCFVVKKDNKIAGSIGYFVDQKNKRGLIASIFVANEFKGLGLSKLLYKKLLQEFSKKKLSHYLGASTTTRVLALSQKIGRVESKSVYIVKL
ncbi:MAG: GNAT family N-acetyltransferase [Bacteriovorax sp.]|nr:GNAT family N-acetyltransferase [Bacteriovorax sp.]